MPVMLLSARRKGEKADLMTDLAIRNRLFDMKKIILMLLEVLWYVATHILNKIAALIAKQLRNEKLLLAAAR